MVPVKGFARGKSRLSPVLADDERARFARELFEHVLGVLVSSEVIERVVVATDADDVAELAVVRGAVVIRDGGRAVEPGTTRLAHVVDGALSQVHGDAAVVMMADLPRIIPADVRAVVDALATHDAVVVRDHLGAHTNVLAMRPPAAMRTRFGRDDSFASHCAALSSAGMSWVQLDNERLAFDVDEPADLR